VTVTLTVSVGSATSSASFSITINAVNDGRQSLLPPRRPSSESVSNCVSPAGVGGRVWPECLRTGTAGGRRDEGLASETELRPRHPRLGE
jgi:hypothetical protein